jgi:hypothetical protein
LLNGPSKNEATLIQAIGGHGSIAELQKYIQEIEQDEQAVTAMALVAAAQRAQIEKRTA